MVALAKLHVVAQSKLHLVLLELNLVLGNNGSPLPVPRNGQSESNLCLLGSGESLARLVRRYLNVRHGESFHRELPAQLSEES